VKRLLVIAAFLLTKAAFAADEFKAVVKAVETSYGIHHKHIPMMGMMLKFTPNHEARSMKLAIFETGPQCGDPASLQQVVSRNLGPDWTPFVRVWSRREHESVVIYAKPAAASGMRLLITCLESDESVIMSVDVSEKSLHQWIDEPETMTHRARHEANDEN
jgi:hypothetical protein